MADGPKTVRGTIEGVSVQTSEETAQNLGSSFEPEGKTAKSSSSKSSK